MAEATEKEGQDKKTSKELDVQTVNENGIESDEDYSDPEDFVDDVSDTELLGDILALQPKETDGVESVIVVDGIPQVAAKLQDKLKSVIKKIYSKFGEIINEFYPVDDDSVFKGYVFLEYSSPTHAIEAIKSTQGHKLDKKHTFSVNLFTDFDKYENVPQEWTEPQPLPYHNPGNLRSWLLNSDCFDQYSTINEAGNKTAIWLNSLPEPTLIEERTFWTETYVLWSPLGTYFATTHNKGIALWGGESFHQISKFGHTGVQFIDFSPCEKYIVTFSPVPDNREDSQSIIVWDIRTSMKKRKFDCDGPPVWPIFKWSYDDKYLARIGQDSSGVGTLSIYETPSFGLLNKKSLKINGIRDFCWSPTDNILSYWVAEDTFVPAGVSLIEIPSRKELRHNNLFNVADCKMHWQKSGNYLCVKVDRYSKYLKLKKEKAEREVKYGGMYSQFEVFHVKEKQIPLDSIEIKDTITAFAWEPVGNKFAIIHGENPNISVSFYSTKERITLIKKLERKQCNHLFWSPNGQFIVLAGLRNMSGTLEFIDTADMTLMSQQEHFMASDVEWDPTGRYVMTGVSYWAYKVDNGYWLWSFQGKLLQRHASDRFCQFLWRPRPPTLLSIDQIKDIKKNLKKYSAQFEMKDRMQLSKASKELIEKRNQLMEEFEDYRKSRTEEYENTKEERLRLRNNVATDELDSNEEDLKAETFEFFIKEEINVIEE